MRVFTLHSAQCGGTGHKFPRVSMRPQSNGDMQPKLGLSAVAFRTVWSKSYVITSTLTSDECVVQDYFDYIHHYHYIHIIAFNMSIVSSLALISDIETISDWIIDSVVLSGSMSVYNKPGCTLIQCTWLSTMACCMSVHRGILATKVTSYIYALSGNLYEVDLFLWTNFWLR